MNTQVEWNQLFQMDLTYKGINLAKVTPYGTMKELSGELSKRFRAFVWMTYLTDNPDGGTEWLYQDKYVAGKKARLSFGQQSGHIPIEVESMKN